MGINLPNRVRQGKHFFFEKKKQKTFASCAGGTIVETAGK
jgi:hypothetical protein